MKQRSLSDIQTALILGSGTLGLRVALQCAISGLQTRVYDISEKNLDSAKNIQTKILKSLSGPMNIDAESFDKILGRISFTTDPKQAVDEVDFVNESVTEDIQIKKEVWKQFGALCPDHAVLTTNTSFLLPSMFAGQVERPERFCAFHFHDVFTANVVDIMTHDGTAPWVVDLLFDLGKKLNQTPVIIKKESSGYIFNYILMHILTAAGFLLSDEVGDIHDIDRSWMGNFNMPIGPFGMIDQIGLDTAWHVSRNTNTRKSLLFADLLQTYIDEGKLGIKSGEGFYKYPNPLFSQPDFLHT